MCPRRCVLNKVRWILRPLYDTSLGNDWSPTEVSRADYWLGQQLRAWLSHYNAPCCDATFVECWLRRPALTVHLFIIPPPYDTGMNYIGDVSYKHPANEGPVRIQDKYVVPIYVFSEMKLSGHVIPKPEL